ncbi:MAG TPA: response regulator transcription factor [Armatimonadota bacterium]
MAPSTYCLASERSCHCSQTGRPVVMVSTGWLEARDAVQGAGIRGYLGPDSNPVQLGEAVRAVLAGGSVYQPGGGHRRTVGALTQRQVQVLELLGRGMTDQEIGRKLGISEATVRNHLAALQQRTSIERRGELCALAASGGLLASQSPGYL